MLRARRPSGMVTLCKHGLEQDRCADCQRRKRPRANPDGPTAVAITTADFEGRCGSCGIFLERGKFIALSPGDGWICYGCHTSRKQWHRQRADRNDPLWPPGKSSSDQYG